jgi:hypothetical protein
MLNLPKVTILSVNCVDPEESIKAINYSKRGINFGASYLFTHECITREGIETINIPKINTIDEYSDFVLSLHGFSLPGDYFLFVQPDGYVLSPSMWSDDFFKYSYIGAPWPNSLTWIERQKIKQYVNFVGNGGFSLRSKKFLELSAKFTTCHGFGEDVFLCCLHYDYMLAHGIKFAPVEVAEKFSRENNLQDWTMPGEHDVNSSFGFHGKNFSNWNELINMKQ